MDDSFMNESVTSYNYDCHYDDNEFVSAVRQQLEITGIQDVLPRVTTVESEDSWDVESYANDSIPIAKLRLTHYQLGYGDAGGDDDQSSLGTGSAAQQQRYCVPDEDDWTVHSDCNDSIGLTTDRLSMNAEQRNRAIPVNKPTIPATPLARISRRRASMGDYVVQQWSPTQQEQQQPQPQEQQEQPPLSPTQPSQQQLRSRMRRKSLSSMTTVDESASFSSHGSGSSNSNPEDPASGGHSKKKTSKSGRTTIARHKSMPYVKPTPWTTAVPLWPALDYGYGEPDAAGGTPREKVQRRVSNGGTPCAA